MKNRWTLHVEDFGNIRSADIEVAPMMLFVGENNTGKSYLASLLWGILEPNLINQETPVNKSYKWCEELMIEYYRKRKTHIGQDLIDALLVWLNEFLDNEKDRFIRQIFSYKDLTIGRLAIANFQRSIPLLIEWSKRAGYGQFDDTPAGSVRFQHIPDKIPESFDLYLMLLALIISLIYIDILYLPASRTGFMLSYKSLAAELMNRWALDKQEIQTTFTLPTIRFLQRLIKAEMSPEAPFADIAESLEKHLLKGRIVQNSQTQSFYYAPESNPTNLMPLHTTSSLVTELAPLIIFLKDKRLKISLLVFEEPESHLHLSAQRILAKHLVKLVNRGVPVWITTHSDTMFQQFNNLIGSTEKRIQKLKNLSYQDDEIIKPEDIKAYQFNIAEDGKTDVESLKLTDDGFPASNFNHTLWNLSKESMSLEAD